MVLISMENVECRVTSDSGGAVIRKGLYGGSAISDGRLTSGKDSQIEDSAGIEIGAIIA
ncbi:hypothetical protein ACVITL_000730 [Rhizobium pisi]